MTQVRENMCSNSKKHKISCFFGLGKNVKKTYVQFHRPLNHSVFSTQLPKVGSGKSPTSNILLTSKLGCFDGATENARPAIARLDNSAPYRKGGHRETCFIVRVEAQYNGNICCREYYMSCASVVCVQFYLILFNYSYVASYFYMRQTKWAVCVISVLAHY